MVHQVAGDRQILPNRTKKTVTSTRLPLFDAAAHQEVAATLTLPRLGKYLQAARNDMHQALRLYVLNTRISAAVMADLHYVEIALRNKFDRELTAKFGAAWFADRAFLALADKRMQHILQDASRAAAKHTPAGRATPPGKVIAELTFGFWLQLTDRRFEHTLWTPALHKAFAPRKAPRRSSFNALLEKLRQLRNRVAHHEPIFHIDLLEAQHKIHEACHLLCPNTAAMMTSTSLVKRESMRLTKYRRKRGL
jgi:hypothetical protein